MAQTFNPFDPDFLNDPYPYYRQLLEQPPQTVTFRSPTTLMARYRDAKVVLNDPVRFSSSRTGIAELKEIDPIGDAVTVMTSDPPVHTRLRGLAARGFSSERIREMVPRICVVTNALLDQVAPGEEFEAMRQLANRLPVLIISEMLGIPSEYHQQFKDWSDAIVASAAAPPDAAIQETTRQAVASLKSFFAAEIVWRRHRPGPDLISTLVAAHDEGSELGSAELLPLLSLLLVVAIETTSNLIGNGLLALFRNPEQLALLREDPVLMPSALEEMLRYDAPVQGVVRWCTDGAEIGGAVIPANSPVMVLIGAANRDPAQFPSPDRFDIARQPNEHLAFGDGIHYCVGADLARFLASTAITAVVERFPDLRLADEPLSYKSSLFARGLRALRMLTA
jgi:cytochrome P450